MASSYMDLGAATAALENKAVEYREGLGSSSAGDTPVGIETVDEQKSAPTAGLESLLDGDFEDEDEEEDSDWVSSEEDTDDEYYEYNEGSDSDCDSALEELAASPKNVNVNVFGEDKPVDTKSPFARNSATESQKPVEVQTPSPPPISITQDKAMHDRITAALQTLSLPCHAPEEVPLTRVETNIDCPPTNTDSTTPPTEDIPTAVQAESHQEQPQGIPQTAPATLEAGSSMRNHSLDASLQRKLSSRSSSGSLRRLKTVCHKYVGRVLVPIRGKAN